MGTSIRVIRVIDNEYTVEVEVEVDDIKTLFDELTRTPWGKKVAYLLQEMLPEVPEYKPPSAKEQAEEEEKRIKEYEEKLKEDAINDVKKEYNNKTYDEIVVETREKTEKIMRLKYMTFIRKNHLKLEGESKPKTCFLKYWERIDDVKKAGGMSVMQNLAKLAKECNDCVFKPECMRKGKKSNQLEEGLHDEKESDTT